MTGTVKDYIVKRGFGFITGDDKKNYFVFWKEVKSDNGSGKVLVKNMRVEFDPTPAPREGQEPIARNVRIIGYNTNTSSNEVRHEETML